MGYRSKDKQWPKEKWQQVNQLSSKHCRKLKIGKCSGRISSSRSTTGTILQTRINYGDKQFNLIANLVLKIDLFIL